MSSLLSKSDIFSSEVFLVLTSTKRKGLCALKGQIFFYFWALLTFGVVDIICHVPSEKSNKIKQYDNVILRERESMCRVMTLTDLRDCVFLGGTRD